MTKYRVDISLMRGRGGYRTIHSEECGDYGSMRTFEELGEHPNDRSAQLEARNRGYVKTEGCTRCAPNCRKE